jgi:hypothetical protein
MTVSSSSGLDLRLVGQAQRPFHHSWTSRDAILYALGVGSGLEDPTTALAFTSENFRARP